MRQESGFIDFQTFFVNNKKKDNFNAHPNPYLKYILNLINGVCEFKKAVLVQ